MTLSPSSGQAIDQSQTLKITATVTNDSSSRGVSWALTGPGSLTNPTGSSVTYTSPTTSITSAQMVTVTATSAADPTKNAALQVTVNPYPQIPFQTLASGSAGTAYSQAIAFTGGTPPFQWSVYDGPILTGYEVGGAVPDGLQLNPGSGAISGTPTGGGTWYFEATVTDATGAFGFNPLSIQINSTAAPGNPVPFLNQPLVPTAVSPGASGFTLSVSGTGFVSGATIDFNAAPLATTFLNSEHLTATVPAADVASAETAGVTVVNPGPGGGASNVVYFQVAAPETTVTFANATNSPLQVPEPFAIVAADFNQDGKPDLAIAANVRMYVFLGNGDGTFAPTAASPIGIPSPPYDDFGSPYVGPAMAVGDFNHTGHLGVAVGLFQNEALAILLGNGDGTFTYSSTLANTEGQPTMSTTAADFNGDGNLDLIAVNSLNGQSPVALLGYAHSAFNQVQQSVQISGISSVAGDFNGDGKLDLVIDGAAIVLGNGDGSFTQGPPLPAVSGASFVVPGDFNGDGKLDLAVCDNLGSSVTILLGNGDGTLTSASGSPIPVGNQPDAIITGDFNNDGKLDLAVANFGDGTITLLLGNGDGTFTQAAGSPYAVGHGPFGIAAADFNGDGKLDLASVNLSDGTVSILLQQ
ncbi:MAG: FG-GAP-like repeat-containing protein [Candidatus Sulfotelmatobacter sp.]